MNEVFTSRIMSVTKLNQEIAEFKIKIPNGTDFHFLPGQHIHLSILGEEQSSGFSLTSLPWQTDHFTIAVKNVDNGYITDWLFEQAEGEKVEVKKPEGNFIFKIQDEEHPVLVGGGIGITPLLSMYRAAIKFADKLSLDLFYSAKTKDDLIYYQELNDTAELYKNINFYPTLTKEEWDGRNGRLTAGYIISEISSNKNANILEDGVYFICGPRSMNYDIKNGLEDEGVLSERINVEDFYEG